MYHAFTIETENSVTQNLNPFVEQFVFAHRASSKLKSQIGEHSSELLLKIAYNHHVNCITNLTVRE